MEQSYDVSIDTPKHHYRGVITINYKNGSASAEIEIEDLGSFEAQGSYEDKDFRFSGTAKSENAEPVEFDAKGQLWGNSLDFKAQSNIGEIIVFGTVEDKASKDSKVINDWHGGNEIIDFLL